MDIRTPAARQSGDVRTYTAIWAWLMMLTVVTVAVAQIHLGKLAIIICLAIASFKSILVLLYFMHLRHEPNRLIRLVLPIVFVLLAIFIGITFIDVITR
jgi:cytochrome c oxidase subunit 4